MGQSSTKCESSQTYGTSQKIRCGKKGKKRGIYGVTHTATCGPTRTCCSSHLCMYINCECNSMPVSYLNKLPLPRFMLTMLHLDDVLKPEALYDEHDSLKGKIVLHMCEKHRRQIVEDLLRNAYQKYGTKLFNTLLTQFTQMLHLDLGSMMNIDDEAIRVILEQLEQSDKINQVLKGGGEEYFGHAKVS